VPEELNYVDLVRHSSPYINAHRGKTFVILLIPGEAVGMCFIFQASFHDLALLILRNSFAS